MIANPLFHLRSAAASLTDAAEALEALREDELAEHVFRTRDKVNDTIPVAVTRLPAHRCHICLKDRC
jgi:hypothetical protein